MAATASAASLAPRVASLRSTKAIASSRAALAAAPQRSTRGARVAARAGLYFPGDREYIEKIAAEFPDKGIANWEEGRCLFSELAYSILDIRADCELEQIGNYPRELPSDHLVPSGIYHVPLISASTRFDSSVNKKVMVNMKANKDFITEIERIFPDKANAKIIISCSDGRNRAIQALEALDEAGYVNIVGLRGGFNMWSRTWDAKMRRRNLPGDFKEDYQHGADTCGVHATGAGFENQDAFQYADWKDDHEWLEWASA
uniref:Rhodanese domain-containing protein n=1 Tax=Mantoniella antarctica TaxID=81844 RepID=A0A7S0XEX7_9CHLO